MGLYLGYFSLTCLSNATCYHLPLIRHTRRHGDAQHSSYKNETHGATVDDRQASPHLYKTLSVTRDNITLIPCLWKMGLQQCACKTLYCSGEHSINKSFISIFQFNTGCWGLFILITILEVPFSNLGPEILLSVLRCFVVFLSLSGKFLGCFFNYFIADSSTLFSINYILFLSN